MCLAVPGRIIDIEGDIAVVDYDLEKRTGKIIEGNFGIGDFVIIQGGIVIQKVPEEEAKESLRLYRLALDI